jgi:ferredoxin-NADP reductase
MTVEFEYEGPMVVKTVDQAAEGVVVLTLVDPDDDKLPDWQPGAHVDLLLADDLIRQYSLCGDPADDHSIRLAVLLEPDGRGGSRFIHERLKPGVVTRCRGPRNHFPLVASPRYLFIAGGIGITPMLPMIAQADAAGADWRLYYLGRSRRTMPFLEELAAYGDRVTVVARDESERLDLGTVLGVSQPDTAVYCCGPERLMLAVEEHGPAWPPGAIHMERFAPKTVSAPTGGERSFDVLLARSGQRLTIPSDRSVFDVLQAAGHHVICSCQEGICGTCEQVVLDGRVDHRDSILTEAERAANASMMICVSRGLTDTLTLDL